MYIVKYSELVGMAEMHSQALASSPYELVPNILRYTFFTIRFSHMPGQSIFFKVVNLI